MTTRRRSRLAAFTAAVVVAVAGSVLGAGQGSVAQFGDAGRVQSSVAAVDSVPLSFVGIDAGENYSMGWTAAGEIFTWGGNSGGQLGNGSVGGSRLVPEKVMLPPGVEVVKADGGLDTVIALAADGGVYTWGNGAISGTSLLLHETRSSTRSATRSSASPAAAITTWRGRRAALCIPGVPEEAVVSVALRRGRVRRRA